VEQNVVSGCGLVGVIFIEKRVPGMIGIYELSQFPSQNFYLFVSQEPNAG
jgi:hypothetical protein